jgi:hypothetical protein
VGSDGGKEGGWWQGLRFDVGSHGGEEGGWWQWRIPVAEPMDGVSGMM